MNFNSSIFVLFFFIFDYSFGSTQNETVVIVCPTNSTSTSYCDCKSNVISCDLSSIKISSNKEHLISLRPGWNDMNNEIRRFCLCGGPAKSRIFVKTDLMFNLPRLHRVDLYKIESTIHLEGSFSQHFSGDVYMSGVRINNIHHAQFGRGDTYNITNVANLPCCSKIGPIENYASPVLYIENSAIAKIEPYGIDSRHGWSTVIMKNVQVSNIAQYGISLKEEKLNISLTGCKFSKLNASAIAFNWAQNVLLSKNVFDEDCHPISFGSVSTLKGSNLILFENHFKNLMFMELDARENVLVWFNQFNSWDNDTFSSFGKIGSTKRNIFISFNVVNNVTNFNVMDIPSKISAQRVEFKENVLSKCDCATHNKTFPSNLTDSRCEGKFSEKSDATCLLGLEVAKGMCKGNSFPTDACRLQNTDMSPLKITTLEELKTLLSKEKIVLDLSFFSKTLSFKEGYTVLPITDDKKPSADNTRKGSTAHKLVFNKYFIFIIYFPTLYIFCNQ